MKKFLLVLLGIDALISAYLASMTYSGNGSFVEWIFLFVLVFGFGL